VVENRDKWPVVRHEGEVLKATEVQPALRHRSDHSQHF